MSKPIHNPASPSAGFTLIELMVAMALSLLLLGMAFTLVQQLNTTADFVGSMSDVNENLRAGLNMMSRDLSQAGENIPVGGIPVPNGGSATTLNRPGPAGTPNFPATGYIPVLTPGYGLGPTQGSGANEIETDIVNIVRVNQSSLFNQTAVNTTTSPPTITSSAATITVSTTAAGYVQPGQLIMLEDPNGFCMLAVSAVNTTTGVITFNQPDNTNDLLGVNQFPTLSGTGAITAGPTSGTILQLETATTKNGTTTYTWPSLLTAYPVSLVTYYLNTLTPQRSLVRLATMGTGSCAAVSCTQVVALGINVMTISYSCAPPTSPCSPPATDPTRNPANPNSVRKVVLTMIAETDHLNLGNGQWYSKSITNSLTIQNLDYANKYSLGASMTQN
jgi:prepilin-type N-terminal cleavage/methylation domain-containing protein